MTVSQRVIVKLKWGDLEKHSSQGLAHVGTQGVLELFTEGFMEMGAGGSEGFTAKVRIQLNLEG